MAARRSNLPADSGDMDYNPYTGYGVFTLQNEYATIASISPDGKTITLTAPLVYNHLGGRDGQGNLIYLPDVVDMQRQRRDPIPERDRDAGTDDVPEGRMSTSRTPISSAWAGRPTARPTTRPSTPTGTSRTSAPMRKTATPSSSATLSARRPRNRTVIEYTFVEQRCHLPRHEQRHDLADQHQIAAMG